MKTFALASLLPLVSAHAIFQRVSVNGADQGLLNGVRSPNSNYPIENANSADIACNFGFRSPVSTSVITVPAGARVGAQYQHIIGGPQGSNDPDNPIAASHKGPVTAYLAKVSNAGTASTSGNRWFKVAEEGLNNGKWGVDTVLANNGWWYFTLPTCIAPGDYLLRIEILALHSAYSQGLAQFYPGCANIRVTGSGTYTPSDTVSFPGAYSATDPGILLNIYSGSVPNNGGRPYTVPGPKPITCPAGGNPATSTTLVRTTTRGAVTTTRAATTAGGGGGGSGAPLYGQCGGSGWTGPTTCASGTCKASNEWYSQCLT